MTVVRRERQPLLLLRDDKSHHRGRGHGNEQISSEERNVKIRRFALAALLLGASSTFALSSGGSTNDRTRHKDDDSNLSLLLGASPLTMRNLHEIFEESNADSGDPIVTALKRDNLFDIQTFPERTSEYDGDLHDQKGADASWYHKPIKGINEENEGKFKMCLMGGFSSWDLVYVDNAQTLTEPGLCFSEIVDADTKERPGEFEDCDVRVFNQGAFLWGNRYIDPPTKGNEIKVFKPPPKSNPNQVDFYYAHEAANHFGKELADPRSVANMDYMATFAMKENAIWYGFGPSVEQLIGNFQSFKIPREERIPSVAYLGLDCMPSRAGVLNEISKVFPVSSIGGCAHNFEKPEGDPGRGGSPKAQNEYLAPFMFYFSVENGIQCPDYITEKMWGALSRGSIPVYYGWDGIEEYIPSKDAIIDLRDYPTPESLAEKLRFVATNDDAYNQMHAWRYQDPSTWPLPFRNLIREVSDDMKGSLCNVLKAGPTPNHPRAKVQGFCADGSHSVEQYHDGTGLETAMLFGKKVGSFQYSLNTEPGRPDTIKIGAWERFMDKTCDEFSGKCYQLKSDFPGPEQPQQPQLQQQEIPLERAQIQPQQPQQQQQDQGYQEDHVDEIIAVEPVLAMEEDCVPGVPTPGVDNCHNKEEQVGNPVTEEFKPAAVAITKPNCNPAQPCIAGIPVPGIGCCTEEEREILMEFQAAQHKPVEVLVVPLSPATQQKQQEQESEQHQQGQQQQEQQQQEQQQPVVEVQKEEQPASVAEEVPKPKELAVPLDCNPDPACIPLKEITPGVMDCCAQTISSDPLLTQDTPFPATPEVKEIEEELQEARIEQVKEIEMELDEAKEELRQQEEEMKQQEEEMKQLEETESNSNSEDINSIAAEETQSVVTAPVIEGEQDAPKVELPSEADAGVTARVFEWGPGHVPPNDA